MSEIHFATRQRSYYAETIKVLYICNALTTCKMMHVLFRVYSCSKTPYFYIQFYVGMPLLQKMIGLLAACRLTSWSLKCNSYPLSRSKLCFSNKFHYSKLESLRNFNYHLRTKTNPCQNHVINSLGDTMYYFSKDSKGSFFFFERNRQLACVTSIHHSVLNGCSVQKNYG